MIKKTLTIFALISMLSSCSEKEKEHDVDYYLDHVEEMKEKLKTCEDNPKKDQNCLNALDARFRILWIGPGSRKNKVRK